MTLHKQWARPFVGCFAFLGFKLPLNVKSIWLSLEQLYMCKCIWVWLPLFFPYFFSPFHSSSLRWCNFSLIHANTCFFKREREERKKKSERKCWSVLFFVTAWTPVWHIMVQVSPEQRENVLLPLYCTSQSPDKVRSLCKCWFLTSGETAVKIEQGVYTSFIDKWQS